jgi:hypothetical protein
MAKMYQDRIREALEKCGLAGYDPRHIEWYMRLSNGTLDGLTPQGFAFEVGVATACVDQGGIKAAESLAKSYGL